MQTLYLGIDIAKLKFDCAFLSGNGKYKSKIFQNNSKGFLDLEIWLKKQKVESIHACMEATGIYWEALAEHLSQNSNIIISVVNPSQIKYFGQLRSQRTKTDAIDAQLIADYCKTQQPDSWVAPPPEERVLRALVMRLDGLQGIRTQENNRLLVAREIVKPSIVSHLKWLDSEIKNLRKEINDYIDNQPDMNKKKKLLETIPGIGENTIATFLSFHIGPKNFINARQAVAFAGLDPRHHESGSSVKGKPSISKMGNAFLRKSLYMPAMAALYKTDWGGVFYKRLKEKGKVGKVIICAMMRKLIHVAFGVLKSEKHFDPSLHFV